MSHRAREVMDVLGLGERQFDERWMVEVIYNNGTPQLAFTVRELEDIDERIELGPDWRTIERIVITLNQSVSLPQTKDS